MNNLFNKKPKNNISVVQKALFDNLNDLTKKRSKKKITQDDLAYSRVLLSNSSKILTSIKLELEYIKVKQKTTDKINMLEK